MLILAILMTAAAASPSALLELDRRAPGSGVPDGWQVVAVRGRQVPSFEIVRHDSQQVLRIAGRGTAGWAHHRLARPIDAAAPGELTWSWRVLDAVAGADVRSKKTDDSPLRVYVVFGGDGALRDRRRRAIFYTWGNAEPAGLSLESAVSDRVQVICAAGANDADGRWREHRVDPFQDYRRLWGPSPPAITAIGIMQDTDATADLATAEVRSLAWSTVDGAQSPRSVKALTDGAMVPVDDDDRKGGAQ